MEEKIKICIVDDNQELSKNLAELLSKNPRMDIVAICKDGEEILDVVEKEDVDIILMDIIMPKIDGIGVLEKINERYENGEMEKKPEVIVISAILHDNLRFNLFKLGVSYYMSKPLEYNILEQRIIEIYDEDTRRKDIETEKQVSKKLYELEIYPNLVGYKYIKRAIELLIKANLREKNYRKNIYSILSEEDNNAPIFKIEKAINNAITTSWNKDKEKLLEIFPSKIYEKKNPSARVFLSTIAEEIINENKKEQG